MAEDNRIHVMDEADVHRAIARMAREIVERNGGTEALTLLGIHRRGTDIALLLRDEIERGMNPQQMSEARRLFARWQIQ